MLSPGMSTTQPVSNPQAGKGGMPQQPGGQAGKGGMPPADMSNGSGAFGGLAGAGGGGQAGKGGMPGSMPGPTHPKTGNPMGPPQQAGKGGMPGHASSPMRQPPMTGGSPPMGGGGMFPGGNFNGPVNPTSLYQRQNQMINTGGMPGGIYSGGAGLIPRGMDMDALTKLAGNKALPVAGNGRGIGNLPGGGRIRGGPGYNYEP